MESTVFLRAPHSLTDVLAGSEGTLAAIFSAELKISPLPREKGLGLVFFASVGDAMQATVDLLDLKPAAIEHIDRPLLDQTKGQLLFQPARDLMELDEKPCDAILIVEFYDDNVAERLSTLQSRNLGLRTTICRDAREMNLAWAVRKAGLSLLTGCVGAAKPVAFIEDAAVRPNQLPEYVRGLESIIKPLGLDASYYGHAASGLLHVRPVVDLHTQDDLRKFRQIADQTAALVKQFKGSLSAEHGVGIARTEYMADQLGGLLDVMREIKRTFDPKNILNPGKIFSDKRNHKIDNYLRDNFTKPIELPFEPRLAFAFKDHSFLGNLEQCNGCGGCRKDAPMMCPTFLATGDEVMSTRGRANINRVSPAKWSATSETSMPISPKAARSSKPNTMRPTWRTLRWNHPWPLPNIATAKCLPGCPRKILRQCRDTIATALGIKKEDVTCHVTLLGGGFGRKSKPDQVAEAAVLSKQLGKPVKVVWTREDDIHFDFFHSVAAMYMKAAIGPDGKPTAWLQRSVFPPIDSTFDATATYGSDGEMSLGWNNLPFDIPNHRAENGPADYHVRIGWLRSVANIYHAYAIQSFADELANAANKDSVEYLLGLIGPARSLNLDYKGDEAEEAKAYPSTRVACGAW